MAEEIAAYKFHPVRLVCHIDIPDNADKKLLIQELIERIDLYPPESRKLSGQWIKTIYFKFPMYYNDSNEPTCTLSFDKNGNFLPKGNTHETVVLISKKEIRDD